MTQNVWACLYRFYAKTTPFYIKDLLLESSPLQDDYVEEVMRDRHCTLLETNLLIFCNHCVCLCEHVYAYTHVHLFTCVWRPGVDTLHPPQLFFFLFFETGSPIKPGAWLFTETDWPAGSGMLLCLPTAGILGVPCHV